MKRKWLVLLLLLVVVWLGWRYLRSDSEQTAQLEAARENPGLILDRVWIDSEPQHPRDFVHVFLAISAAPIGAFQKASAYHVTLELFEFEREGNKVSLVFPQTNTKKRFRYKVESCDDLPPFDLCLRLNTNPWGGPTTYYSMRDAGGNASLQKLRHKLMHRLELHPQR